MSECLAYPTFLDNDEVIHGGLMQPNSLAAMKTYAAAVTAKATWEATQANKNPQEMGPAFLAWRVAAIGHNLTVAGRMLIPFYIDPPRSKGLPPVRCYDGIVSADGTGGVTHYDPYAFCDCPDLGDMAGSIMAEHWRLFYAANTAIDKAIAEDALARAIRHCNYLEAHSFARQAQR